ncbi:MAG: DUF421 domain-containing protein [Clostridia bacterium]|nr:DUF421 domain-containing protein [Clostridia bacterium]
MFISIIRTAILYSLIIIAVRFMGKRQIGDLQTTELVVTMLLSDIASLSVENASKPLLSGLLPMTVLVVCEVFLSGAMLKNSFLRKTICGRPIIVINDGEIQQKELKRLRMSVDDLSESLRQQDVFSFDDVLFGIVETNGKLSVMKKPEKENPTNEDLKIKTENKGIETVIISDGEFSRLSMQLCDVDEKFVKKILAKEKIDQKDVFIMTLNMKKEYNIIKRSDDL